MRVNKGRWEAGSCQEKCFGASVRIQTRDIGRWVHLAAVYDGANWHLHRNGERVASSGCEHGAVTIESGNWVGGHL